jgi:thiol-disulfide isomerase/thioredoxin
MTRYSEFMNIRSILLFLCIGLLFPIDGFSQDAGTFPPKAKNRGWLGVGLEALDEAEQAKAQLSYPAVRVRKVFRNSPAAKGGFKAGDLILKVAKSAIRKGVKEMVAHVQSHEQGDTVLFTVFRDQVESVISVVLDPFPNQKNLLENEWKNQAFPEVSFVDLHGGSVESIQSNKGKVIVLDYWATWCGPCRKAAPSLEKLRDRFSKEDVLIAGITSEDRPVVDVYDRNNPANYPIWLDTESAFSKVLGARSLPTFVVVDREGKVQRLIVGLNGLDTLESVIEKLL